MSTRPVLSPARSEAETVAEHIGEAFDFPDVEWTRCSVWRIWPSPPGAPSTGRPRWCGDLSEGQGMGELAEFWGGGQFDLQFKGENGRVVKRMRVVIEGRPKWNGPEITQQSADADSPAPEPAGLNERLDRLERLVLSLAERPSTPAAGGDMFETFAKMLAFMESWNQRSKPSPDVFLEYLREGLKAGREMAAEADPRTTGDALLELGRELGPSILEALQRKQTPAIARVVPAQRALVRAAQPQQNGKPVRATVVEKPRGKPSKAWANALALELARGQKDNDDPAFAADWIERYVPANVVDMLQHAPASVVKEQLLRMAPLVRREGVELSEEYVNGIVAELLHEGHTDDGAPVPGSPAFDSFGSPDAAAQSTAPAAASVDEGEDEDEDDEDEGEDDEGFDDDDDEDEGEDDEDLDDEDLEDRGAAAPAAIPGA